MNDIIGAVHQCLCVANGEPLIEDLGSLHMTPDTAKATAKERTFLTDNGRPNETCYSVIDDWCPKDGVELKIGTRAMEYATLRALRKQETPPILLSSSVLAVCYEKRTMYFQHRSDENDIYPGRLHTFAGVHQKSDGKSLVRTALREFDEETGIHVENHRGTPNMLGAVPGIKTLDFVLLGLPLRPSEAEQMKGTSEGDIYSLHFDDLFDFLLDASIAQTPALRSYLLGWVGLGISPDGIEMTFSGMPPGKFFEHALDRLKRSIGIDPEMLNMGNPLSADKISSQINSMLTRIG